MRSSYFHSQDVCAGLLFRDKVSNPRESSCPILVTRQHLHEKQRAGGSTNTEKIRKKNSAMSKFSYSTRQKIGEKSTAKQGRKQKQKSRLKDGGRAAKKRRRKN